MKEATGELNMTVITVVAIAAVGLIFTLFVWPNIQGNLILNTACSNVSSSGNYTTANGEGLNSGNDGYVTCSTYNCTAYYNGKTYTKNCKNH